MTLPLIDGDILAYEVGFASERRVVAAAGTPFEAINIEAKDWEAAKDIFDGKIKLICDEVQATEKPIIFLTEGSLVNRILNKQRKRKGETETPYTPNFREALSKTKEYKGNRKESAKPFHYKNLINYMMCGKFRLEVAPPGLEADDWMSIYQTRRLNDEKKTIICSRDKDLKQCLGAHYTWECGNQRSIGPIVVEGLGELLNVNKDKFDKAGKPLPLKVLGTGSKFFYYQMITGDSVDNIQGIMGRNKVFAYGLLRDASTERECYELTAEVYVKDHGDEWQEKWDEMASLCWIVKELDENGGIVSWTKPVLI